MKQKMMLMAVLLVTAAAVKAQYTSERNVGNYQTSKIYKIKIDAKASVLLVSNNMQQNISAEGDEAAVNDIITSFNGEELVIASKSGADYKGKLVIKVPVKNLESLEVNAASEVVSVETLQSKYLDVVISSDCKLRLKSTGQINVSAADGYDFDYLYRSPRKVYINADED